MKPEKLNKENKRLSEGYIGSPDHFLDVCVETLTLGENEESSLPPYRLNLTKEEFYKKAERIADYVRRSDIAFCKKHSISVSSPIQKKFPSLNP